MRDPIRLKDAELYGLSPLILNGLTVAGLPIRWMTFTPVDQPRSFRDVLLEAWRNAEGLRGRADILRINRHLAAASPELAEEGDACPCEIVPRQGPADPSWRYILINTYGEPPSIVMAPRGAKITERLPKLLLNYDGIRAVAPEFYRDVVSTCARACR